MGKDVEQELFIVLEQGKFEGIQDLKDVDFGRILLDAIPRGVDNLFGKQLVVDDIDHHVVEADLKGLLKFDIVYQVLWGIDVELPLDEGTFEKLEKRFLTEFIFEFVEGYLW